MIEAKQYAGQTIAIMGLGRSGWAAAHSLRAIGAIVQVWDDNQSKQAEATAAGFNVVDLSSIDWHEVACLLWSPGIPHTLPKPHPVAQSARTAGVAPVCDIELLMQSKPIARCVGVTGTNGKSTTTALIAHILLSAGYPVVAGGNLGLPVLDFPPLGEEGIYVIELSSYQLELTPSLALDVAVLLNITPDHLGRHGGMGGYVAAKQRIFTGLKPGGTAVVGVDDASSAALCELLQDCAFKVVPISAEKPASVYALGRLLREGGARSEAIVADLSAAPALPGQHNGQNAAAAFAAVRALSIKSAVITAALQTFLGLAHRQELVAVIDGIRYINDSKATNADAAEKVMTCYDIMYWIAGGQAKEGGITALAPLFPRIRHAFLIGEAASAFANTLEGRVPYTSCGILAIAVTQAHALAAREHLPGAVVLLSPACASWDQFNSFEHRGAIFRELVATLASQQRGTP